jgi:hypothetical protein
MMGPVEAADETTSLYPGPVQCPRCGWPSSDIKRWLDTLEPVGGPDENDEGKA